MNPEHQAFINDWLDKHYETSCVDQEFHEAFRKKFGGRYKATYVLGCPAGLCGHEGPERDVQAGPGQAGHCRAWSELATWLSEMGLRVHKEVMHEKG